MHPENENPVALAGAHRADISLAKLDDADITPTDLRGLAAAKIARRFRLPLSTAGLVADLAGRAQA